MEGQSPPLVQLTWLPLEETPDTGSASTEKPGVTGHGSHTSRRTHLRALKGKHTLVGKAGAPADLDGVVVLVCFYWLVSLLCLLSLLCEDKRCFNDTASRALLGVTASQLFLVLLAFRLKKAGVRGPVCQASADMFSGRTGE